MGVSQSNMQLSLDLPRRREGGVDSGPGSGAPRFVDSAVPLPLELEAVA